MRAVLLGVMVVFGVSLVSGCSSVRVRALNPEKPDGVPFMLTKQLVKVTTTTTRILSLRTLQVVRESGSVEREVIEVMDPTRAYSINKTRPFAGESKFSMERTNASNLAKLSVEDKEGVTEFLKGLAEGAKTLVEAAAAAKEAAGGAPAAAPPIPSETEKALLAAGYFAEQTVAVTYEPVP